MEKIPENERKLAVGKLNDALTVASDNVALKLNLNEAARVSIRNMIAEAFAPALIELGLVSAVKEDDSIPS
jgi:ABC-type iron transport system FetAB permease component